MDHIGGSKHSILSFSYLGKEGVVKLHMLKNEDGLWITEDQQIIEYIRSHYLRLFTKEQTPQQHQQIHGRFLALSDEDWQEQNCPFAVEEIKQMLFEMEPCKAPGPDGFSVVFYQKAWGIVGKMLIKFAMKFFKDGILLNGCNNTLICLIPKVPSPETVNQLRPIGLCNVSYKLLTKVMASRIKEGLKN